MAIRRKKVVQVIGTRPQLIKVIPELGPIINTGQHYEVSMNDEFLEKRNIKILENLEATELEYMILKLKKIFEKMQPEIVVVYGDTRSTLAGALAANEMNIKVAHVEAGVRCFNDSRPEERIRKVVDHIAYYHFCPTMKAIQNLEDEGIFNNLFFVGDVLYDRFLENRPHNDCIFLTLHRQENVDKLSTLVSILKGVSQKGKLVLWPMHPRVRDRVNVKDLFGVLPKLKMTVLEPLSHRETLLTIKKAYMVITDSGGVIREAYWSGTPVEVIGDTEWGEIYSFGQGNASKKIKDILNV